MSNDNRLASILLIAFALFWVVLIGFFTKDLIVKDTKVEVASYSEVKEALEEIKAESEIEPVYETNVASSEQLLSDSIYDEGISKPIQDNLSTTTQIINTNILEQKQTLANQAAKSEVKEVVSVSVPQQEEKEGYYKGYETIGKIEIPAIGLNYPILKYQSFAGMEIAPCLVYSKGEFNRSGFSYITGHNYRNGLLFSNLNYVKVGDSITITSNDGTVKKYTITEKYVTSPKDVSYLKVDEDNKLKLILQTCTDNEENRLIVIAKFSKF